MICAALNSGLWEVRHQAAVFSGESRQTTISMQLECFGKWNKVFEFNSSSSAKLCLEITGIESEKRVIYGEWCLVVIVIGRSNSNSNSSSSRRTTTTMRHDCTIIVDALVLTQYNNFHVVSHHSHISYVSVGICQVVITYLSGRLQSIQNITSITVTP